MESHETNPMVPKHQNAITVTCSSGCRGPHGIMIKMDQASMSSRSSSRILCRYFSFPPKTSSSRRSQGPKVTEERLIQKNWAGLMIWYMLFLKIWDIKTTLDWIFWGDLVHVFTKHIWIYGISRGDIIPRS